MNARGFHASGVDFREITELLLLHGAELNLRILVGQRARTVKLTGRVSDLHRSRTGMKNEDKSADTIIQ